MSEWESGSKVKHEGTRTIVLSPRALRARRWAFIYLPMFVLLLLGISSCVRSCKDDAERDRSFAAQQTQQREMQARQREIQAQQTEAAYLHKQKILLAAGKLVRLEIPTGRGFAIDEVFEEVGGCVAIRGDGNGEFIAACALGHDIDAQEWKRLFGSSYPPKPRRGQYTLSATRFIEIVSLNGKARAILVWYPPLQR